MDETRVYFEDNLTWCAAGLQSLRSVTWDRVREATSSDVDMHTLEEMATDGIPDSKTEMPETIRDYHQYRENITSTDGVILYKDRVIVPPSLRGEVLSTLHAAHQGVSMMTARAESSVFWPGISADISATRKNCEHCHRMAPSQPGAPPTPPTPVVYPFQAVCSDFFVHRGRTLPRDGGQILKLANHIAVDRWRHRSHQPLTSRVRNVRDARRARIGRRSRVHLYRDQGVLAPMGRTPPPIIGSLPSQQLSCRDWSKDDETTHHRQHRSEGRTGH